MILVSVVHLLVHLKLIAMCQHPLYLKFFPSNLPLYDCKKRSESCSTPPTTPLDELALKRHRFFADLIDAAHAAIEHRVRFDPLGPKVDEISSVETEDFEAPLNSNLKRRN